MIKKVLQKKSLLSIKNLSVSIGETRLLRGISLNIQEGDMHVILGPNGSGKSTLLSVIMGHPTYTITQGSIVLDGKKIENLSPDARAREGIFLGFQSPPEIPGVTFGNAMRMAQHAITKSVNASEYRTSPIEFARTIRPLFDMVGLDSAFLGRSLNTGFSGGEKKKSEIIQMTILEPRFIFLDEIDSGLDITSLRKVLAHVSAFQKKHSSALVLVTHNPIVLKILKSAKVHILSGGKIIRSGGAALAREVEKNGYGA